MGPIGVITEQEIPWDPNSAYTFQSLESYQEAEKIAENKEEENK